MQQTGGPAARELEGLFPSQYVPALLAGETYVSVRTVQYPEGEIRGQIKLPPGTCPGDSNRDGVVSWRDIDYFVAAMNDNESAWQAKFATGMAPCSFAVNDVNGDGHVSWRDITPFVEIMNTTCP